MKKLLSILLLFVSFVAIAQTYDTLPAGSKPYGNFYLGPDGNLVFGNAGLKYRLLGTKKRVDSLLALKAPVSGSANYIQNNNTGTAQNASFNINGIGRFDSPTATTLFGPGLGSFSTETGVTTINGGNVNVGSELLTPNVATTDSSSKAANTKYVKQLISSELPLKGKTVLIMGTSIEEGTGAIEAAITKNGGTSINIAVGSSIARKAKKDGSYSGLPWEFVLKAFSATVAEKNAIISNWTTIRDSLIGSPPLIVTGDYETIRNYSYERKLLPYLNGTLPMPDYFFMGHGYNDGQFPVFDPNESYLDFVSQPTDSVNRNYFLGAENFIVRLIKQYNPNAIIIKGEHYENQKQPYIVQAQREVARKWEIPLFSISENTGWSSNRIANTQSFWNTPRYSPYKASAGTDTLYNMTELRLALPDGVHPYSDLTGNAKQKLTDVYDYQIKGLLKKGYYVPSLQEVLTKNNVSNRDIRLRGNLFIDKYKQFGFTNDEGTVKWAFSNTFDLSDQDKLIINTGLSIPLVWHQNGNAEWSGTLHTYNTGVLFNGASSFNQNATFLNNKQLLFSNNVGGVKWGVSDELSTDKLLFDSDLGNVIKLDRAGSVTIANLSGAGDRSVVADASGVLKPSSSVPNSSKWQGESLTTSSNVVGDVISYNGTNWTNKTITATAPLSWNNTTSNLSINLSGYQTTSNLSSVVSASATNYPSNTAVINYLTGNYAKQGGNSLGAAMVIGTNDANDLKFVRNGFEALTIGSVATFNVPVLTSVTGYTSGGFINSVSSNTLTANINTDYPNYSGTLATVPIIGGTAPAPTGLGVKGQTVITGGYRYECIATNTWVRHAVETTW